MALQRPAQFGENPRRRRQLVHPGQCLVRGHRRVKRGAGRGVPQTEEEPNQRAA